MPYTFNPFTSNFDKVEQPPIGFGDVFHLNPLTADQVVVGAGTDFVQVTLARIDANGRLTLPEGNVSGLIFGDGDSGIWERTDDNLRFVTAGVERITLDSTFFRTLTDGFSLKLTLGTETSPTYRFQNDQNTGIYQSAADHLDFTTGGLRAGYFDSLQFFNLINPLGETSGGTGLNTYDEGDLLFASAIDTLSKLAIGNEGEVLTVISGIPSWQPDSRGLTYNVDATQTIATAVNNAYITTNALTVTATLPATAAVGDVVCFKQFGAGKIVVAQNAGQTIHTVSASSTTGAGGSLETIDQYSSFCLVCVVEDTDWMLESGSHGGFIIT